MAGDVPEKPGETLDEVFYAFCERWVDGERPDLETFLRRYPRFEAPRRTRIEEFLIVTECVAAGSAVVSKRPKEALNRKKCVHGKTLGDFRIVREIGRGGMGVVYEAEQISLNRTVALKVLPAHLTLREESIVRFKREAACAARLKHPNIVEVYAIGEEGETHFFAMEFVEGAPLDQVIDRVRAAEIQHLKGSHLSAAVSSTMHRRETDHGAKERAENDGAGMPSTWNDPYIETVCRLVALVADALDFAHKAGVIHRDVKPSNILVHGERGVKLTDFGLARLEGLPSITATGEFAGTPHYVSPEQARSKGMKVDHRADIYALGVTLFEFLTLRKPFDGKTSQEVLSKIIFKATPFPRKYNPQIPRDLETICLTAMEKDPNLRYPSAKAFAEDLRRFLERKPVRARPLGLATRTLRLIRRNPAYSALIGLIFLVVVAGPLLFGLQQRAALERTKAERDAKERALLAREEALRRADASAERARREADTSKQVCDFLVELFKVPEPSEARGKTITAFELLKVGAEFTAVQLEDQPGIQARLMETLGSVYLSLGLYKEAAPLLEKALATHIETLGEEDAGTLASAHGLANLYRLQGRFDEAARLSVPALAGLKRRFGLDHEATLAVMNDMAVLHVRQYRYEEAEPIYTQTLEARRRLLGPDHPDTFESMDNLAFLYMHQGRYDKAEPLYLQTIEGRKRVLGPDHPDTLTSLNCLAVLYAKQGRYDEAEPLHLEALEEWRRIAGSEHPDTITSLFRLALLYLKQERHDEAEPLFLQVYEERRRILGEEHPKTLNALMCLAFLYHRQERREEAEPLYKKALEGQRRILGIRHQFTLSTMSHLARFYHEQGRDDEAKPLAREAVENTPLHHPDYEARKALLDLILKMK